MAGGKQGYAPCEMWLGVSKGMLPVKNFCSMKPLFASVELNGDHKATTKMR